MTQPNPRPLFSVIIPTYNRAAKVVRAVESVLAQTLADFDVWVIDDGSSDATAERLAPYLGRIHYVKQANGGVARARNRGFQESTGTYLALLDSDDRWQPHKLAAMARAIQAHPKVGLFYSQFEVLNEAGARLYVDYTRKVAGSAYRALLLGDFLGTSTVVLKRACLEAVGEFDPTLRQCEDWDLWLRIARNYPLCLVPEILVSFEHAARDKVTSDPQPWLAAHDRVIEKALTADPALSPEVRRAVRANLAYVKGRVCLQAGSERDALGHFKQAVSIQPSLLKAQGYVLVLSAPRLRRLLPLALRRRLRLPGDLGSTH